MTELLIGACLGVLLVMGLVSIGAVCFIIYSGGRFMGDLEDLDDRLSGDVAALQRGVNGGFAMLDGAVRSLANQHGLVWDEKSGDWTKVH